MYISNSIILKLIKLLKLVIYRRVKAFGLQFLQSLSTSLIIGALYRHPTHSIKQFSEVLSIKLAQFNLQNDKYFLLNDFNVDITATKHENYLNQLSSCGAFQVIVLPTSNKRHL